MLNKVLLIGRIGQDLELRQSKTGLPFLNFSVATTEKSKEGEKTEWHKVVLFGKSAENTAKYCGKGSLIFIEGRLSTSKYEKNGQTFYKTEIIADVIRFLNNRQAATQQTSQTQQTQPQFEPNNFDTGTMDDIPF